ncbi:ArsR family transcriptional regulator (plasmid) [Pacificitalea manganoxidans]|uniref:ArsR family transcriptional regulator n=1 Tax=Pacificitalea manganoxidans TaxID=1411902 RepID=A0A291M3V2_9RHOB|nr:DeoR/GlpR family DNA-binding transcription regulator [Pacificitalea manganoxidans]ATI43636.1 ArsR family transcriptional regulator [Pacificitalea manganoxidans]MBF51816.1 DeoR/GlpR transcriptional regulator [Actibacterium sp.]MDR6309923.1 DeoR family glycerol-3-phosphate regulon repressor [Pacificitalea manganoxidans]OWU67953.1 hypothetical protein ATO2_13520 [Roseovarius sp. 22II1-1F6A]
MAQNDIARRRDRVVNLLSRYGELSAGQLADMLEVTVQTIRADLRDLDDQRLVRRRHGGASLVAAGENIGYAPRQAVARDEKARIGAAAAALVSDGATVALGTGTTVEAVARALLPREKLFVATNNIHAALALQAAPELTLSLAGGRVRLRDMDLIGAEAGEFFAALRLDLAVFSAGGIGAGGEILDFNEDEVRARRAIMGAARHRVLVVDHTKIGRDAPCLRGSVAEVETLIHGGDLPPVLADLCAGAGTQVIAV